MDKSDKRSFKYFEQVWNEQLSKYQDHKTLYGKDYDAVTCFSAYCLGACGPDFWTLPTNKGFLKLETAGIHFDLGHYNRTHHQFLVALDRWKNSAQPNGLQAKVEQAYFLGMATHIGADLIIHQLVNTYAGAYNLLEKTFENEHGYVPFNLWNTHNKVEHFWDSYIRLRYLGDYGQMFIGRRGDSANLLLSQPLGLPTKEGLGVEFQAAITKLRADMEQLKRLKPSFGLFLSEQEKKLRQDLAGQIEALEREIDAKEKVCDWLNKEDVWLKLEQFLNFPRVACDRIMFIKDVSPFVYDIVVNKDKGAYPKDLIFTDAADEAAHKQMDHDKFSGKSEFGKLEFFSAERNKNMDNCGNNYLTYIVCPDLEHVRKYAKDTFYDFKSLPVFVENAVKIGTLFLSDLKISIDQKAVRLGVLGRYWNLDTGTGLRVEAIPSATGKEVITRLNFCHITEQLSGGQAFRFVKNKKYLNDHRDRAKKKETKSYKNLKPKANFSVVKSASQFNDFTDIYEESTKDYFYAVPLKGNYNSLGGGGIDGFFKPRGPAPVAKFAAPTKKTGDNTKLAVDDVRHRLNLMTKMSIVEYGEETDNGQIKVNARNKVGFYFLTDRNRKISHAYKHRAHGQAHWLSGTVGVMTETAGGLLGFNVSIPWEDTYQVDCIMPHLEDEKTGRYKRENGRCVFESRLLVNLEKDRKEKRKIEKGHWNNVISYEKKNYGRNYAVSTGREEVLQPDGSGNFMSETTFKVIKDVSPTEHVFFTLYTLVRNGDEWYDAISKEPVDEGMLKDFIKIECLGFMKIVLFYEFAPHGAMQLSECYIDGSRVAIGSATLQ